MAEGRPLVELLLDQEESLRDLLGMVIAVDLIASGTNGIETDDMPGLKVVARGARELAERVRQAWRETVDGAVAGVVGI